MADDLKFLIEDEVQLGTRIKVVGVGGGGSNAVSRMLQEGLGGIEFYVLNTDKQALAASPVANKLAIGKKLTSGLGAGADPSIGRQAALEDTEQIIEILEGADMVFVTAGLGGGTGTGAAPVVASLAKELNALTVAVVTKPFAFEGPRRMRQAERGLAELAGSCDTLISIPNEKLLGLAPKGTSFVQSFRMADDILRQAVQGIADIITTPGTINRDFSDIRTIMVGMGYAMMGTAVASGDNAPIEAAQKAINSPLMEEGGVLGARGMLINITASSQLGIHDVNEACNLIRAATQNDDAQINFGLVLDESMADKVKITVIATGFQRDTLPEIDRRNPHFPFTSAVSSASAPPVQAEPEPAVAAREPEPEPAVEEVPPMDDYEMPAILRKQRRMVQ
jgi:cell division protein FtsZ